jgi:hypothetical protein
VGVPHENIKGVSDIVVLDGIKKLMAIQVFSFKTLEEALMVASKDKPEEVQSTINDFNKVADLIETKGEESLSSPAVIALLEDVVKKMPNHQSAQILLSVAKGEETKLLSLGGSFHQINTNISGIARKIQMMSRNSQGDINSADRDAAKDALNELEAVSKKIDSRLRDFNDATMKVLTTFSEGREDDEDDDNFSQRIKKQWESVNGERSKLMNDPEIVEELQG